MGADYHVLHVRSSAGLYGAEYVILGLLPALRARGAEGTLLCLHNPNTPNQALCEKAQALGLPAQRLPCRGRFDFATVNALRGLLARHPNALLHVHDYKSALNAWLARGRRNVPIVATSHGQFSSTLSLQLYHRLELSLMRRFERVCIVAEEMRPLLMRKGVAAARIVLIPNGIDTRRFAPEVAPLERADFGIDADAIVFGAAMRLTEQKNPLGLIDAFARVAAALPRAVLAVVGDGELRDAVAARACERGVAGRVRLLGARGDLERFYTMIDVFVLPSLYEGLPLALLEAMAAQRPIVATAVGEVGDVLTGLGGALVPPGDAPALAGAMHAAALQPPATTAALRARVVERNSVERMAGDYAALYDDVWKGRERVAA
jgi:glycosyltransferase involved in cell wall biosynthesis